MYFWACFILWLRQMRSQFCWSFLSWECYFIRKSWGTLNFRHYPSPESAFQSGSDAKHSDVAERLLLISAEIELAFTSSAYICVRAWVHPLNAGGKYPLAMVGAAGMVFHWPHYYWIMLNCISLCVPPNTTGRHVFALTQKRFLSLYVDCKTAIKAHVVFGSVWLLDIKCRSIQNDTFQQ